MAYTILEKVKIRLKQYHLDGDSNIVFDRLDCNPLLEQLIDQVRREIRNRREYPSTWAESRIEIDLEKYESNIIELVCYDFSKVGGDYSSSYSENGISRQWVDRDKLFSGIYSFAKFF